MFWIIYFLVLFVINMISTGICLVICLIKRNKDYRELNHRRIRKEKGSYIERIDAFYSNGEKVESLIKSGSILYRKAKLSNKLKEKVAEKEVWFSIGSAVLSGLISSLFETDKITKILAGVGIVIPDNGEGIIFLRVLIFVMVAVMLFNIVQRSMDDVRSEAYRYELSHIEKILNDRINLNKPSKKRFLIKDKDGRTSIVTLRE